MNALWARARGLLSHPSAWTIIAWTLSLPLLRPFGDYPLNDDWTYARIARNFVASGHISLDSPVASSVVGQVLIVWPIIKIFGFSNTILRIVTMLLGLIAIVVIDRLMARAQVTRAIRFIALLALVFNPIFFYTDVSFMTEFYGYVPGLVGALVWFRSREANEARSKEGGAAISWTVAIGVGALFGCTFWVRQFCASIYPALPGATVFGLLASRRFQSLKVTLPRLLVSGFFFAVIVQSFFPWAKATGNFTAQFQGPLGNLRHFEGETFFKHAMLWLIYMSVFSAPLLVLLPWNRKRALLVAISAVLICAAYYARYLLRNVRMDWVHPHMPFLGNLIEDTGVGPITLSDVYWSKMSRPRWQPETWMIIEVFCVHAVALFAPMILGARKIYARLRGDIAFEILLFGLLVMLGSVTLSIQAFKMETLDRYHMPSILVMPMVVAISVCALRGNDFSARLFSQRLLVLVPLLAIGAFTIAGLHDYFRWNDARWALVRKAENFGATPEIIEGGYEVDAWLHFDEIQAGHPINGCIGGRCRCDYPVWHSKDCSYHIGMNAYPGYETIATIMPSYWLAPGPSLKLSRRLR